MYSSKLGSPDMDRLFDALLTLKTQEELYRFFDDLATIKELQSMAQRLHVAELLDKGERYASIAAQTGASTATISRVSRCLRYGADGYKTALARLEGKNKQGRHITITKGLL